ncbi:MAG TPA: hypothetical protein VE172_20870 [Stackebrandtia sp.]|uniref:hypothetical protein n=1 Tax=Stackebrandtia sp. TaxID=2023065 RepID=UPI002D489C2A|nr:hypothetical protein [Stackebrandtia sp.]HZE41261.1 hypothetical protein [Stackebrandtia sp.]
MAILFGNAAGKVDKTRSHESDLFETPGWPAGVVGPVLAKFVELRDQLQNVARTTCINLRDSGAGCVGAANDFAKTDLNTAEKIDYENNKTEFGKDHKATPPPDPPKVPAPTPPTPPTGGGGNHPS